jgi:energy-coupling factor transporter transmembrane protein EcfT
MATNPTNRRAFHPAVSILSWLVFAMAVEFCSPHQLVWVAVVAGGLVLPREAARRFLRLAWKAKWLWLALVLLYAYTVPGTYVGGGAYSPTYEGIHAGGLRAARLLVLLAALARLLVEFTPQQLAGGLYVLAAPLDWLKFDRRALAVRLALTWDQVDKMPKKFNWLEELGAPSTPLQGPDEIRLVLPAAGPCDGGLFLGACLLLAVSLA